jgi:hypothetical protein
LKKQPPDDPFPPEAVEILKQNGFTDNYAKALAISAEITAEQQAKAAADEQEKAA